MGITPSPIDIVISGGFCHFSEDFVMMINLSLCQKINCVQWDQSSPGNSATHYSDLSMIKFDFSAA